jgi:hypothetical protein
MDLTYEDVPMASSPLGNPVGTLICVTTPSVIREIIEQVRAIGGQWIDVVKYANPELALRYEVGMFDNVRFVPPAATSCGMRHDRRQMATARLTTPPTRDRQLVDGSTRSASPLPLASKYVELSGGARRDHRFQSERYGHHPHPPLRQAPAMVKASSMGWTTAKARPNCAGSSRWT